MVEPYETILDVLYVDQMPVSYTHLDVYKRQLYHRYVLGVYDLLEKFLAACPNLLLEGCSGGGGRYDASMMYYSCLLYTSKEEQVKNGFHCLVIKERQKRQRHKKQKTEDAADFTVSKTG